MPELPTGFESLNLDHPAYQEIREENARKSTEINELIHRVFKQNPDGEKLMAHFEETILRGQVAPSSGSDALWLMEGKRQLVLEIKAAMGAI